MLKSHVFHKIHMALAIDFVRACEDKDRMHPDQGMHPDQASRHRDHARIARIIPDQPHRVSS
uniref:Uncharacterized protein n=1 Tax=mine drainage metagenome TaxID=410659 RepID=E6PV36_9ZZZZ